MILPLETFRGIFAITIVLHHLRVNTFIHTSDFIQNGGLVVDFFFVLSGFVIAYNYIDKINNKNDLIIFQKKRFYRLYPLHLLTLFVFIFIEILKLIANKYTNFQTTYVPFGNFNNFFALISNFFLIHGWYGWSYNLPSWSISTEFYTYFIFGLIICYLGNKNRYFYLMIFFSLLIFMFNQYGYTILDKFVYPTRCIYSFFIGVITHYFYSKNQKKIEYIIPLIFTFLSLFFISESHKLELNYKYIFSPILFSFTIFFVANLKDNNFFYKILTNKFFVYLGSISYGVYMIHFAIVWFFRQISRFLFKISENGVILIFNKYVAEMLTFLVLAIVIFLAHISLHYFENKFKIKKN